MPTRPTGRGPEIVEIAPTHCVNGHPLRYPNVQCSYLPCSCAYAETGELGHSFWRCWTCGEVRYEPAHTDDGQGVGHQPR